jgi:phenylalanyl-tRNA synthetase alpha chain
VQQPATAHVGKQEVHIFGETYARDASTNVTNAVLAKVGSGLHRQPGHPLCILAHLMRDHFGPRYAYHDALSPIVTPAANFDSLGFPPDHPGRSLSDSYYINADTHTSAHQVELLRKGDHRFLLAADVYRRDEIDRTHYPVFHQVEGVHVFEQGQVETIDQTYQSEGAPNTSPTNPRQACYTESDSFAVEQHLKASLEGMIRSIFAKAQASLGKEQEDIKMRWVEAFFPFTSPSYELEVWYDDKWMEVLGCGVIQEHVLARAGLPSKIGWAFGIGLERLAMALFRIPDIRLFWSQDPRFLRQFSPGRITHFEPFSRYPSCTKDISFWLPEQGSFHPNDLFELVRDIAGDLVEDVKLVDSFVHPKTKRESHCYRITYCSMER